MSTLVSELSDIGINPRETGLARLNFAEIFANDHPVVLEIGSGKGRFLLSESTAREGMNFLGIEKSLHFYRVIVDRLRRHDRKNVRVINYDAYPVLAEMIPAETLSEIHIYFPDPWPRKRELKRRIIRAAVVKEMERVLKFEGIGFFVTDHREYFEASVPILDETFLIEAGEQPRDAPTRTNYEAKYRREGRPIYQIAFKRRSSK